MATTRFLFANLPAELRNEVYAYLSQSTPTSTAHTTSIPLKLKTYTCKHTTITLQAVHYGASELLDLAQWNVAEANEYRAWLLENGLQLRIALEFTGRVNNFIQADWIQRLTAHLRKLQRTHPWLCNVAAYDIRIVWRAVDMSLVNGRKRKQQRVAGRIVHDMAAALTSMMDENVKRKWGDVRVRLCFERWMAGQNAFSTTRFGLREFLRTKEGFEGVRRAQKEVWVAPVVKREREQRAFPLAVLPQEEMKNWFRFGEKLEGWKDGDLGHMVSGDVVVDERAGDIVAEDGAEGKDNVLTLLAQECRGLW